MEAPDTVAEPSEPAAPTQTQDLFPAPALPGPEASQSHVEPSQSSAPPSRTKTARKRAPPAKETHSKKAKQEAAGGKPRDDPLSESEIEEINTSAKAKKPKPKAKYGGRSKLGALQTQIKATETTSGEESSSSSSEDDPNVERRPYESTTPEPED